ncbi:sensor histidine kinase [Paenibacillus sp. PL2-23]|uniref:sensor histidine kinase n=1 Tax=Paenibacillus sp. PL2-23 TaxID=2100729 RepID=UPI0030F73587
MLFGILLGGFIAYRNIVPMLDRDAQSYSRNLATQINGRLEALLIQADTVALQAVMDNTIQADLTSMLSGGQLSLDRKLDAGPILNRYMAFAPLIQSIEIYNGNGEPYAPVYKLTLASQLSNFTSLSTQLSETTGKLFWLGLDSAQQNELIALREIMLLDSDGTPGGYELVRLHVSVLNEISRDVSDDTMIRLYDQTGNLIHANHEMNGLGLEEAVRSDLIDWNGQSFRVVHHISHLTGWTLAIMIPIQKINEPIEKLQYSLTLAGIISVGLAILLSYWISLPITKSIYQVRKIMQKARRGQLTPNPVQYVNREANELNMSYNKMVNDIHQLIEIGYQKELAQHRAEIKTLHAQIHPHFLYNTLEAINWILREQGQNQTASLILDLSELFRYSISSSEFATLEQELTHVKRFLALIHMRIDEKLDWMVEASPNLMAIEIPKLIIQPIVENAVQHGIEPSLHPGSIRILATEIDEYLDIIVTDTGIGCTIETLTLLQNLLLQPPQLNDSFQGSMKTGIGLLNVHRRIQMQYGDSYGLSIDSSKPGGTTVRIRLPKPTFRKR